MTDATPAEAVPRPLVQAAALCTREPVLNASLLARIHELNRDYVELMLAGYRAGADALPGRVLDSLARLPRAARKVLAATPYALYSFGLGPRELRAVACADGEVLPQIRYVAGNPSSAHNSFCEIALFFAWHVTTTNPVAARVIYAMPSALAEEIAGLSLWQLRRIAADRPGLPMPRWCSNPCFWPDLVRFAARGDASRLATTQLLGNQLIAAELDGAENSRARRPPRRPSPG